MVDEKKESPKRITSLVHSLRFLLTGARENSSAVPPDEQKYLAIERDLNIIGQKMESALSPLIQAHQQLLKDKITREQFDNLVNETVPLFTGHEINIRAKRSVAISMLNIYENDPYWQKVVTFCNQKLDFIYDVQNIPNFIQNAFDQPKKV